MGRNSLVPVSGFEGSYYTDEVGNISNTDGLILKQHTWGSEYLRVYLYKDKKYHLRYVHRIVAESYHARNDRTLCVNHIDGDKTNNHKDNLEWVTQSRNRQHAYEIGAQPKGEDHPNTKLTDREIEYVRSCGLTNKDLSVKLNVSPGHILGIRSRAKRKPEVH